MLSSEAAGVPSSHQRLYMERSTGGGNGWSHFDVGYVDNVPAARTRSYTIGSSLDPAIDALKAAVEQAAPFIASRNPFTSSSATTNPSIATNSSSVPQFDRRCPPHYGSSDPPPEADYDYTAFATSRTVPYLLSLVSHYRTQLREYALNIESAAVGAPSNDIRTLAAKRDVAQDPPAPPEGMTKEAIYTQLARCCATWLETLSHQAFSQPPSGNARLSQIDNLAASIPPAYAEEAISSLLKTAILQSLLLTRVANDKSSHRCPSRGSMTHASAASFLPATTQAVSIPPVSSLNSNAAFVQALRESPSDSTITSLLKEVDLQRIAAKFSTYATFAPPYPTDVGSLIRSTGSTAPDDSVFLESMQLGGRTGLMEEARHRSYSDIQQHETLPRTMAELKTGAPTRRSIGVPVGGDAAADEEYHVEESTDVLAGTRKKKSAQQRAASPSAATDIAPLSTSEGVHVPQLDLDAILMPSASAAIGATSSAAGVAGDASEWQQRIRQAVRKGTASLLSNNCRHRVRSQSDLVSKVSTSDIDPPVSEDIDLRPTWMRKPKLYQAIKSKLDAIGQQKPVFYVEWNILGFLKVLNDPSQDRIVSPEYAVSVGTSIDLPPLRLMVSICHGETEQSTGGNAGDGSHNQTCQYRNIKIGVEFTIPANIEVRYHVFHGSFFSEARWHSFKDRPWAGVNAHEVDEYLPHPIDQNLTVGVILLEIRGKGLTSQNVSQGGKGSIKSNGPQELIDSSVRQEREGLQDNQPGIPSSPRRLINPSASSRQVSWVQAQAAGLGLMLHRNSGASLSNSSHAPSIGGRPRAYSDWQGGSQTNSSNTSHHQLRNHLTPPTTTHGPMALPSVSDLLRLSGAPEALLAQAQRNERMSGRPMAATASMETPSMMFHESLSRMNLSPADQFDKQLFTEIWSSSASPTPYEDLVFGCLR